MKHGDSRLKSAQQRAEEMFPSAMLAEGREIE
jgi:hypothetical protein